MSTTPRDIFTAAYGLSTKNQPDRLANESSELLNFLITVMRGVWAAAARLNPTFFAETADVVLSASSWARPAEAESIFRVEARAVTATPAIGVGTEVIVVPFEDMEAEKGKPTVYEFAQRFYPAQVNSPTAGTLRFYYSARCPVPATVDTALDARWPETFNRLLICEVGAYLAAKDGRTTEAEALAKEATTWHALFAQFLQHATACEVRRFARESRFNTKTLVPGGA